MTIELSVSTVVDNSEGLRRIRPRNAGKKRTLNLLFEAASRGGYHVRAWGESLQEDGGGAYAGRLELGSMDIYAIANDVRNTWNSALLGYQESGESGSIAYPFSEMVDLTQPRLAGGLDQVMRNLARAGHRLFRTIFYSGDRGLREIGDAVTAALRSGPQVITVHSEDLFAPWPMLYLPPSDVNLTRSDAPWTAEGFVGHRHLIEHNFKRSPAWEPRIGISGKIRAGLNVDRGLDAQFPSAPTVGPVVKLFGEIAQVTVRESRQQLADDITSSRFDDQLIYFGCHGVVSGGSPDQQAYVILTDREPIYTSEFRYWLGQQPLRYSPMVFVNACQGGQMSSQFYTSFARVLLQYGASCLVGPQVDIPPAFAAAYATAFATAIIRPERRMGDIVHGLAQEFLRDKANPLGLTMALYRGLDVHFGRIEID